MKINAPLLDVYIQKITRGKLQDFQDTLAVEEPLEITLSYLLHQQRMEKIISITMRTPGNDEDLAIGFLFTEGILQSKDQLDFHTPIVQTDNKVKVNLHDNTNPNLRNSERNFYTTSSCGVCGKSSIEAIKTVSLFLPQNDEIKVASLTIIGLVNTLQKQQALFSCTGGLHASALFDVKGNFIALREDVGRHNALDKLIGYAFLQSQLPLDSHILLLSGRASFELIQKATMSGIKVVVAIGAPSSLAVQLANENGITLIGFLRGSRFNIYSGNQRIIL